MKLSLPNVATMSRRERLLVTVSALVVCVVLLDRLVLGPWWRHIANVRKEIGQLEEGIRAYRQLLTRAPVINREVDAHKDFLRTEGQQAPTLAALLREIESLGAESGVSLGEVKPSEGASNALYQEYAIDVEFRGSLEQSVHFVHLLQSSTLLFGLERATLQRAREELGVIGGSLRLTSKVFRGKPGPEGASAEGSAMQNTGSDRGRKAEEVAQRDGGAADRGRKAEEVAQRDGGAAGQR